MLAAAIIVFREVLEASLIIGIVLAASRGATGRGLWVSLGILGGVTGALITAYFADTIADAMEGMGTDVFNACVLLAAVLMLGWHNVWMSSHAKQLVATMSRKGAEAATGEIPLYSLAIVVALAVLREGAEIVLFFYGMLASNATWADLGIGGFGGLGVGGIVGASLYFGLLRIPTKHLFTVTGWMILLLAAGMASSAMGYLVQADLVPALGYSVWDTSAFLAEDNLLGQTMHTLVGYTAQPDGIQLVAYAATLIIIGGLMKLVSRNQNRAAAAASAAAE